MEEEREMKALEWLLDAFPSMSLEQIASAYSASNCDLYNSAHILAGATSPSSSSIKDGDNADHGHAVVKDRDKNNYKINKNTKKKNKKISVCTGTVSSVVGNGYLRTVPMKTQGKKPQQDQRQEMHVEEFLYAMMGDGWQLDRDVVRTVLSQCGYDVEKSLNILLEMAATSSKFHYEDLSTGESSVNSNGEKDGLIQTSFQTMSESFPERDQDEILKACEAAEGDIEQALSILLEKENLCAIGTTVECSRQHLDTENINVKSNLEQLKLSFPDLSESALNEILEAVNFNYSEAKNILIEAGMESRHVTSEDKSRLPRQLLESLFNVKTSSEKLPSNMDFVKAVRLKKKPKKFIVDNSVDNLLDASKTQISEGEEDGYELFHRAASQHWAAMRSYFQEAAAAYSKGERARAGYLSAEGNHYKQLAREADEKASQRIFDIKNKDMHNDVTIDLHSQHVKDAIRLLKLHIQSLASISSIHSLKVITGCGSHGTGRGRIKRAVTQLLEKEGINWTEENPGVIVIKIKDVNPENLSFVNSNSDD